MFKATVSKYSGDRIALYPPRSTRIRKHHGRRVKVLVVVESE